MKEIILSSESNKNYCLTWIKEKALDGKHTVILKKTDKSPTAAQRRLQWLWNSEVAMSGLGSDDDKMDVHIRAKYQFCRPILLRDNEIYGAIDTYFHDTVKNAENKAELIKEFARDYISTEQLTRKQRTEYLTEFQRFWLNKGVNLTNPEMQGVDLKKELRL